MNLPIRSSKQAMMNRNLPFVWSLNWQTASGTSPTAITTGTTSTSPSVNWKKPFRRCKKKTRLSKNFILEKVGAEIRLNHYFILLLYDLCPSFSKKRDFFVPY